MIYQYDISVDNLYVDYLSVDDLSVDDIYMLVIYQRHEALCYLNFQVACPPNVPLKFV